MAPSKSYVDKFYSKIAKALSEFMVLTIIHENPKIHTYEIQNILHQEFGDAQSEELQFMSETADILDEWKVAGRINDKIEKMIFDMSQPQFKKAITILLNKSPMSKELSTLLNQLHVELSVMNSFEVDYSKIWATNTGIYQLMKELENYELITVIDSIIVRGRTRKLYEVTREGEIEMLKMFLIFLSLNKAISRNSQFLLQGIDQIFENHIVTLIELFNQLQQLSTQDSASIHEEHIFHSNPFLQNQVDVLLNLIRLDSSSTTDSVSQFSSYRNNEEVITELKLFQGRLNSLIKYLEL